MTSQGDLRNSSKKPETRSAAREDGEHLPRRFGRLTLLRRLARGGMGEVYLASTGGIEGAERPCVVKIIRREHASDKSFRARFLDETRIQAQLQHPGVAQILEASTTEDDCPYAVVEYVEGRHMGEVLQRSAQLCVRLDWPDAVALAISFGDALAHVHERTDAAGRPLEIAHRDLSPQNVMVGYAGDLKLIDFGTARGENRRCRTVNGIVFAKPGYVAPEVANQTPGGAPADLYAFGVMLWELVAGRRFLQGDAMEHQAAVARGEKSLPALAAEVGAPSALDEVIARLTASQPEERFKSARIAVGELVDLLKRAPSLANGDRSVRGRIAHLMQRLYPAEPARSRADFARRVAAARRLDAPKETGMPVPSPEPPDAERESNDGMLPGTRYRLGRCLGRGAMGEVFEAHHVDLGRSVAIKLLPQEAVTSAERRQRFRAEARAIAKLDHPNLVKLHDFGVAADGRFYYAMELLDGESLAERLARAPLDWREATRIAVQASAALVAAHETGVVHRDITPGNLFVTKNGTVKLLDFGVACFTGESSARDHDTRGPAVVGTPEYLAPEQAAGADVDARADVYALGAVLYEMLTGQLPHPLGDGGASNVAALLTAKITATPAAPHVRAPERDIPKSLDRLVVRALCREPDKRYQSAQLLQKALESIAQSAQRTRRWSVSTVYTASAVASAVAGFLVVFGIGRMETRAEPRLEAAAAPATVMDSALEVTSVEAVDSEPSAPSSALPTTDEPTTEEADSASDPTTAAPSAGVESVTAEHDEEADSDTSVAEAPGDATALAIAEALHLVERRQRIKGYNRLKRIAHENPKRADAQRGWSLAAVRVKAWGEALRAARNWVELDPSVEARLHLAKMQKANVRGNEVETLEDLLRDHPEHEVAQALLEEYRAARLARR